jgi:hypothetical protein
MVYAYAMIKRAAQGNSRGPQAETVSPQPRAPLSPHWAFVVQVRQGSRFTPDTLHGRVEHIVSGRASTFVSLAELLAFIEHVLTERKEKNG